MLRRVATGYHQLPSSFSKPRSRARFRVLFALALASLRRWIASLYFFLPSFPLTYEEARVLKRFSGFRGISRGLFLESCSRVLRIDGGTGFMKRDDFWICSLRSYVREIFFFFRKFMFCDVLIWIDIIQCEPIFAKDTRGENNRAFVK